jgi:NAD(P)-dependent dehydrogenase (short-subunit alcohol dehydrogenase family)
MTFASYPSLAGRVVLITGGGSGIGASIVRHFCAQSARVAFIDVSVAASCALRDEICARGDAAPLFVEADLRDIGALRSAVSRVEGELGPIRALVNNAARDDRHDWREVTPEYWNAVLDVNLRHQFFALQAVAPGMATAGGGSVINFGSISWMRKAPGMVGYTTAKAAVEGLTRTMARELGPMNIRVNAVVPGATRTERQVALWWSEETMARFRREQCLDRIVEPPDVARMALFLAADDSAAITAQSFRVDAGLA